MESISVLLNEALAPYKVVLGSADVQGNCKIGLIAADGQQVLERLVNMSQFQDLRSFTDVADGLHRDLLVAEGRLEPSMLAAMRSASQNLGFSPATL
jgi:hypothetical protein